MFAIFPTWFFSLLPSPANTMYKIRNKIVALLFIVFRVICTRWPFATIFPYQNSNCNAAAVICLDMHKCVFAFGSQLWWLFQLLTIFANQFNDVSQQNMWRFVVFLVQYHHSVLSRSDVRKTSIVALPFTYSCNENTYYATVSMHCLPYKSAFCLIGLHCTKLFTILIVLASHSKWFATKKNDQIDVFFTCIEIQNQVVALHSVKKSIGSYGSVYGACSYPSTL